MTKNEVKLTAKDGKLIHIHCWKPDNIPDDPIIVQIAHGMAEHGGRYDEFANFLVENNFIVYANDHRGHGLTVEDGIFGYFADKEGWDLAVDDLNVVNNHIRDNHTNGRIFLLGHSMGSFLVRRFVQCYNADLKGLIISGTGWDYGILGDIGIAIAKIQMRIEGRKDPSVLLNLLSFGRFNKAFKPIKTPFDWLSRDSKKVKEYIEDPYCAFAFTSRGFYDMLGGIKELHKKEELKKTPKDIPIYMFSGELDPVGKNGKGVRKVYYDYISIGCKDVKLKLYPEGRHEMLNEINRYDVYKDIIDWIYLKIGD